MLVFLCVPLDKSLGEESTCQNWIVPICSLPWNHHAAGTNPAWMSGKLFFGCVHWKREQLVHFTPWFCFRWRRRWRSVQCSWFSLEGEQVQNFAGLGQDINTPPMLQAVYLSDSFGWRCQAGDLGGGGGGGEWIYMWESKQAESTQILEFGLLSHRGKLQQGKAILCLQMTAP